MLLRFTSLVAILFQVGMVGAAGTGKDGDGEKKHGPTYQEYLKILNESKIVSNSPLPHPFYPKTSKSSAEIKIPPPTNTNIAPTTELFTVPLHVLERRGTSSSSRNPSGDSTKSGSGQFSQRASLGAMWSSSPPEGSSLSGSMSSLLTQQWQFLNASTKEGNSDLGRQDAYSYHASLASHPQSSSDECLPEIAGSVTLMPTRSNEAALMHHQQLLYQARLNLSLEKPGTEDGRDEALREELERIEMKMKAQEEERRKRRSERKKAIKAEEQMKEMDEQSYNRRRVTLDNFHELHKGRSNSNLSADTMVTKLLSASSNGVTPKAASSKRRSRKESAGDKKTTYMIALPEIKLDLPPSEPTAISTPTAMTKPAVLNSETTATSTMPFDEWSMRFRLPADMAPLDLKYYGSFSRCEESDPVFLSQLESFRTSLKTTPDGRELLVSDYVPFADPSRPWDEQLPNRPVAVPPMEIFETQPIRHWSAVECSLLGMNFEVVREHEGRERNSGRKSSIEYVKHGSSFYVRKIFNSPHNFWNEVDFLQVAHHDFLPRPVCIEKNQSSIILQYIDGLRIHDAMYQTVLAKFEESGDPDAALAETWGLMSRLVVKLMTVTRYIHNQGLIHCDIKPENVIYEPRTGRIVLIDFDLSVTAPYVYSNRGTSTTVAPEITGFLRGPAHFGADWWGFGCTVAIMTTYALAGYFKSLGDYEKSKSYIKYVPFAYNYKQMSYQVTPIPPDFPAEIRQFLFPFFSPHPAHRIFSEKAAFEWATSAAFFRSIDDINKYSVVRSGPAIISGFIRFSQNPAILIKSPHYRTNAKERAEMWSRMLQQLDRGQESSSAQETEEVFDFEPDEERKREAKDALEEENQEDD